MSYMPDKQRNASMICVVQDPKDVIAMEKMRDYQRALSCPTWGDFADGWCRSRRY